MKGKYKYSFDQLAFRNRWKRKVWNRNDNWTIFGLHKHWFGHDQYSYQLCFFGFDIILWIKREWIETTTKD